MKVKNKKINLYVPYYDEQVYIWFTRIAIILKTYNFFHFLNPESLTMTYLTII